MVPSHAVDRTTLPVQLAVQSVETLRVAESASSTTGIFVIWYGQIGEGIDRDLNRPITNCGPREPTWLDCPLLVVCDPLAGCESVRARTG